MRIALHDTLLEHHLIEWLESALRRRGHEVLVTGPVLHDQRPPETGAEQARVARAAAAVLAFKPDGLVAFRPFSMPLEVLHRLGRRGTQRMLFLGDDPVHYALSTRAALPHYDVMLHAGHEPVLRFYEDRHGPTGVTMPFWADPEELPRSWKAEDADVDLVFLGNVAGEVRSSRAGVIDRAGVRVRIHGNVGVDVDLEAAEWLETPGATSAALARGRAGLNIPQIFAAYAGGDLDFPELGGLGHFWIPSRAVQYAAAGMPIVTVAPAACPQTFPGAAFVADGPLLAWDLRDLLSDGPRLSALASRSHHAFLEAFTADARAELIEWLVSDPGSWRGLTLEERAHRFELHQGNRVRTPPAAPPRIATSASGTAAAGAAETRRVVVSGYFGKGNLGDDILLDSLCQGLHRHAINPVEIVVTTEPPHALGDQDGPAFDRDDLAAGVAELRRSSALIVGPGGLVHEHGFARAGGVAGILTGSRASVSGLTRLPLLARLLSRDVHLAGVGVGPLDDVDAQAVARTLGDLCASISVRDAASRDLLRAIDGWTAAVATAPDLAYAWELPDADLPLEVRRIGAAWPLLAVNVRDWPAAPSGLHERLAAAVGQVSRLYELAVVGVPMQRGPRGDRTALQTLLDAVDTPYPKCVLDEQVAPGVTVAVLRRARGLVAMRLHACLLAHRCRRPVVGLAYDPKVQAHFAELGCPGNALPLDVSPDELAAAIAAIAGPESALAPRVATSVGRMEDAADASLLRLAARIDAAPPATPVPAPAGPSHPAHAVTPA